MAARLRKAGSPAQYMCLTVAGLDFSSTGERGPSLLNMTVSGVPPCDSLRVGKSAVARPVARSRRLVGRRLDRRCLESMNGHVLERCWQQPLNVAQ